MKEKFDLYSKKTKVMNIFYHFETNYKEYHQS